MSNSPNKHRHPGSAGLHTQTPNIVPGIGVDVPELQEARRLWQMNRFDAAVQLFEHAVAKYPQNLVALIDASRALGARFEITKAETLLDRLAKLGKNNPQVLHLAGQSYRMIFRPEKAMQCFERLLARTQQIPDAHLELAVLYERRHRVPEALKLIENCLAIAPDYREAELFKARLLRRMQDTSSAEKLFRTLADNEEADPLVRCQALIEIAHRLDKNADYDGAMSTMLAAKTILLGEPGAFLAESEALQGLLREIAEGITAEHWRRWIDAGRTLPQHKMAVLTGFPRTGTTLLEQVLDAHPGLVSSDEREAFGRDIFPAMWRTENTLLPSVAALDAIPIERLAAQRERYLAYMSAALNQPIGGRVHLDKNPTMTLLLPAMLRLFPETRLLIAIRDPRDVVLSCFMQYLPLNTNSVCFLTLESAAKRYAHDMTVWLRLRETLATPWLEVRYEDCVENLESQARRVLDFLQLPWDPEVLNYRERMQGRPVSSPTYEAVSRPLYKSAIGRWRHYRKYLEPVLPVLQPFIEAFKYPPS